MPFALLDDKFHSNAKVYAAGNAGAGLYCRALSYCADHLTDGFVPYDWAKTIGTAAQLKKLESVSLWQNVLPGNLVKVRSSSGEVTTKTILAKGYWIPDYLEHNPSRAEVEAKRKIKAEAGRKGAEKRWQTDSSSDSFAIAPANQLLSPSHSVGNAPLPIPSQVPSSKDKPPSPNPAVDEATRQRILTGTGVLKDMPS